MAGYIGKINAINQKLLVFHAAPVEPCTPLKCHFFPVFQKNLELYTLYTLKCMQMKSWQMPQQNTCMHAPALVNYNAQGNTK